MCVVGKLCYSSVEREVNDNVRRKSGKAGFVPG